MDSVENTQQETPVEKDPNMVYVTHESSGKVIAFPKGTPQDQMRTALSNFEISTIPQDGDVSSPGERFDWWDLGSEMSLTVAGAALGQRLTRGLPAPAQFAGTTVGAAGGTALHFLGKDFREGEQFDYEKAVTESMISMGLDVATLGAQRMLPDQAWLKLMRKFKIDPNKVASDIVADLGSPEMAEQAQEFLASKGLGLLPSQTQVKNAWFSRLKEKIGRLGLLQGSNFDEYSNRVNEAVRDEFEVLFNLSDNISVSKVADNFDLVYRTAQTALSDQYSKGLDSLLKRVPPSFANANPLKLKLDEILKGHNIKGVRSDGTLDNFGSELQPETLAFLNNNFSKLMDGDAPFVAFDAKSIIQLEKQATAAQRAAMDGQKTTAANEIKRISGELKGAYGEMLERIDPKLAGEYKLLKERYAKGMDDMFPELTGDRMKKAIDNGTLYPIANAIVKSNATSARQVKELMSGITRTYGRLRYTNPKDYKEILASQGLPESPKEFKKQLRQSFLLERFGPMLTGDSPFSKESVESIRSLFRGESNDRVKVLFGEQYKDLKKFMGIIDVVSRESGGQIADLAVRSKQYTSAGTILTQIGSALGATGATLASPAMVGTSALILTTPHFMAKAVMNPKLGTSLLKIGKNKLGDFKDRATLYNLAASEFLQDLTQPEVLELATYLEARVEENKRKALVEQTKTERIQ